MPNETGLKVVTSNSESPKMKAINKMLSIHEKLATALLEESSVPAVIVHDCVFNGRFDTAVLANVDFDELEEDSEEREEEDMEGPDTPEEGDDPQ